MSRFRVAYDKNYHTNRIFISIFSPSKLKWTELIVPAMILIREPANAKKENEGLLIV